MMARALWTVAEGRCEIREEALPPRAPDQALVRCVASGISRGTERLVLMAACRTASTTPCAARSRPAISPSR